MNLTEILQEAIENPENWFQDGPFRGGVNWNWIDSDLWLHPDGQLYEDQELYDGLNDFPDSLVPKWGEFIPRTTHPLP